MLIETYGSRWPDDGAVIHVYQPGEVYAGDEYVYWGFTGSGLAHLAGLAGYRGSSVLDTPIIDGHPRIIAALRAPQTREDARKRGADSRDGNIAASDP